MHSATQGGFSVLTRREDVIGALQDWETFSSGSGVAPVALLPVFEIIFCALTVGICTMMMHTDDRGRSVSARIGEATRLRKYRYREAIAGFCVIMLTFTCYIGFFAVCRVLDLSTNVAHTDFDDDWPCRSIMTYDPDGRAEDEGVPGPYYRGEWAG